MGTGIKDRPDLTLQIAYHPGEEGAARHPVFVRDRREFVHVPPRPEPKVGDPWPLILPEQVQRKLPAGLDQLPRVRHPADANKEAGDLRDDGRGHHPAHDLAVAPAPVGCSEDEDFEIHLVEHGGNASLVHGFPSLRSTTHPKRLALRSPHYTRGRSLWGASSAAGSDCKGSVRRY